MPEELIGRLVRNHRRALDLTQEELARRVGCAAITVRKIEADDLRPSQQIAERLAMALGIPLEERAGFVRLVRTPKRAEAVPSPIAGPLPEDIGAKDLSGKSIRGYALGERIAAGGMGVVYRAVQPLVEREVAIKIILPRFANHPDFIRRFEAEAQLVARLEHPHIVPLYDYWREPGVAYLVMRLLRGGSLHTMLQQGRLSLEAILRLLEQIGAALHVAHRAGVIHRDLKPANILFDEHHNAYLADFGIAKNLGNPDVEDLTLADAMIGSPNYISPEQIHSETVRPQTDIYALGVMLYELLTGVLPFHGVTPIDVLHHHLHTALPSVRDRHPDLSSGFDEVIQHATAKNMLDRYASVNDFVADFRNVISDRWTETTALLPRPAALAPARIAIADNPYKGLRAFGEGDAQDFFGRETLTQQLLARLSEHTDLARFLAVVGASGSGKSSVVKAGLLPALRNGALPGSEKWFMVEMLPGPHPLEELEAALLRVAVHPPEALLGQLNEDPRGLLRAARRCLPEDPAVELLIFIDQFEEVFTLTRAEGERAHFLNSLVTTVMDERSRVRVVVTLRADFIDRPLAYVDFGDLLRQRMELVLPLTPDELDRAIRGPAERVGLPLEAELAALMVRDVSDQPGALPLLQYALTELFEQCVGAEAIAEPVPHVTRQAYAEIGGVLGALGKRAEAVFASLDEAGRAAARQLFLRLVTLGEGVEDTRRRALRAELEQLQDSNSIHPLTHSPINNVLEAFGKHRLLSFDRDLATRGSTVEVAHEALFHEWQRLREWLAESRADVRLQRQLAHAVSEWENANHDVSFLLTGAHLAQFEGWAATTPLALTQAERAFLTASVVEREQHEVAEQARQQRELAAAHKLAETERARADSEQHRATEQGRYLARVRTRNRVIAMVGALAIIIAIIAAIFSGIANTQRLLAEAQRAEAEKQTRLALARELTLAALNATELDPELSILLALQAVNTTYTVDKTVIPEAHVALAKNIAASRVQLVFSGHDVPVNDVEFSPNGEYLYTAGAGDATARKWDVTTSQPVMVFNTAYSLTLAIGVSPDGTRLATASSNALTGAPGYAVELWDTASGQRLLTLAGHTDSVIDVAFDSSGQRLATASADKTAKIWDVETGRELFTLADDTAWIFGVAFSPDGAKIATGNSGGIVKIWDAITGQPLITLTGHNGAVYRVAFSSDSKKIATSSWDGRAALWDVATGGVIVLFPGHTAEATGLAFSPNGQYLAVASWDGTVDVWDISTSAAPAFSLPNNGQRITGLAYSADGKRLATSGFDKLAKIWDATPGERTVQATTIEELLQLAQTRITRTLTEAECQQYLHAACP